MEQAQEEAPWPRLPQSPSHPLLAKGRLGRLYTPQAPAASRQNAVLESLLAAVRTPSPSVRRLSLHCTVFAIALVASVEGTLFG